MGSDRLDDEPNELEAVSMTAAGRRSLNASNHSTSSRPSRHNSQGRDYSLAAVSLVFVVPALGGLLFGYDIAATSFVLRALTDDRNDPSSWAATIAQSAVWQGVIVSLSSAGAWLASWMVFASKDVIGRRTELSLGASLYLLGALLEFLAGIPRLAFHTLGLILLILGRLVYGIGIGVAMHAAPTYLGEMSPSSVRGILVSLKEACIVLGMVLGYTVGWWYGPRWNMTYLSSWVGSIVMLLLSQFIPESCRWLLLQGPVKYKHQALLSLEFVFPHGNTALQQLRAMQNALRQEGLLSDNTTTSGEVERHEGGSLVLSTPSSQSASSSWKLLLERQYRKPLVAGIGLVVLQQVTGQPSVLSYATQIFAEAGVAGSAAIAVALFKLASTLVAACTVERYGRTKLLLAGCWLMLLALVLLMVSFGDAVHLPKIMTLLAMFAYIGGYQVGFGPITWLLTSEIFPLAIRGQAVALAVQLNFLLNAAVQLGVPVLQRWVGLEWTFALFALLDVYSLIFIKRNVPETKGLTLEEIEALFAQDRPGTGATSSARNYESVAPSGGGSDEMLIV